MRDHRPGPVHPGGRADRPGQERAPFHPVDSGQEAGGVGAGRAGARAEAPAAVRPPDRVHRPDGRGVPRDHRVGRGEPAASAPAGRRPAQRPGLGGEGDGGPSGAVRPSESGRGRSEDREHQGAPGGDQGGHPGPPNRGGRTHGPRGRRLPGRARGGQARAPGHAPGGHQPSSGE